MKDNAVMVSIALPTGFRMRAAQLEDAQAVTDVENAEYAHYGTPLHYEAQALTAEWTMPTHNLTENSIVVENADGRIVASADLWADTVPVRSRVTALVHPDYYDRQLRECLLMWAEARARTLFDLCPSDVQISLMSGAMQENTHKQAALSTMGYQEIRRFYQMRIDMNAPPTVHPLPEGYHYEIYCHPEQLAELVRVDGEAFRDHFGYIETDLNDDIAEIGHFLDNLLHFDPSLFFNVIEDSSGQIVAEIWNLTEMDGNPSVAYIDSVGVLREHRGRGIAIAMLTYSLAMHYAAGRYSVALHVDADSLTGALRLYEKAGMHPVQTSVRYEKILRAGRDLVTRGLGDASTTNAQEQTT